MATRKRILETVYTLNVPATSSATIADPNPKNAPARLIVAAGSRR